MAKLCTDLNDGIHPFTHVPVDLDVERECTDEWSKTYAIAIVVPVPHDDDGYFDKETFRTDFEAFVEQTLIGDLPPARRTVIHGTRTSPSIRRGTIVLQFHPFSHEIELYVEDAHKTTKRTTRKAKKKAK